MKIQKLIGYPSVGAQFIAPSMPSIGRRGGRNELRPYRPSVNLLIIIIASLRRHMHYSTSASTAPVFADVTSEA